MDSAAAFRDNTFMISPVQFVRCAFAGVAFLATSALGPTAAFCASDSSLLGRQSPEWSELEWLNSPPLHLRELVGKVVLVRWWTAPHCPYCRATAPALNEFHGEYHQRGLEVIGIYHHKSPEPLTHGAVKQHAARLGFEFPIAIDRDWRLLKQWWLDRGEERWTSVSFLLDRRGVVRHIHPGGQYVKGDPEYAALKAKIEELLAEK
jgi:peroxiredoxin